MKIIDAHIHQWDLRKTPREASSFVKLTGWNQSLMHWVARRVFPKDVGHFFGAPDQVLGDYLPASYLADTDNRTVAGFVHVEAGWRGDGPMGPVNETRWLENLESPLLAGIVGYADLSMGASVASVLEAHMTASGLFRGVRYSLAHHPGKGVWSACEDPKVMQNPRWRDGYAQLGKRQLSFDATVYHHQLGDLVVLARDFPDVPMILCHAGTPTAYGGPFGGEGQSAEARETVAQEWRGAMTALADLPHVSVKLSGLAMPILGWGYHHASPPDADHVATDIQPIVDFIIDTFGADRCMFASNFPVDRVSMPWTTLYDAFEKTVSNRSEQERAALFHGTATRAYRIDPG